MSLLKKENWFVNAILSFATLGFSNLLLGYMLEVYDKDAWYHKWEYWFGGIVCFIFPAFIMLYVFAIQITIKVADKLKVPGREIYASPYSWILCLVVPVLGWILLIVMFIYINVWILVMLSRGEGEKYVKR